MLLVQMKRVIDTSEVLGTVELPEGVWEVCATADAGYDESAGRLVVNLDAFLRTTDLRQKERRLSADWLPQKETIRESLNRDECHPVAVDIFYRWVRRVRQAAPALHQS
jgi:hypothetical protein